MFFKWKRWLGATVFVSAALFCVFFFGFGYSSIADMPNSALLFLLIGFPLLVLVVPSLIGDLIYRQVANALLNTEKAMRDLPRVMQTDKDLDKMINKFGARAVGNHATGGRESLRRALKLLVPGEKLYYIAPHTSLFPLEDYKETISGVLFVSNSRIVYQDSFDPQIVIEFPLSKITSVSASGNGQIAARVSFYCGNTSVAFNTTYRVAVAKGLRGILIQAIAQADHTIVTKTGDTITRPVEMKECTGCGASVAVYNRAASRCQYCGNSVKAG